MKWVGMGLCCLMVAGCATVRTKGPRVSLPAKPLLAQGQEEEPDPERAKIVEEITKFYYWLRGTRQLVTPVRPYDPHGDRWAPRKINPDTGEVIPEPEPVMPSEQELIDKFNELLKDPAIRKEMEDRSEPL